MPPVDATGNTLMEKEMARDIPEGGSAAGGGNPPPAGDFPHQEDGGEVCFRALFDDTPEAMLLVDGRGTILAANRAVGRLGLSPGPRPGNAFLACWPQRLRPAIARWLDAAGVEGRLVPLEVELPGDRTISLLGWRVRGAGPVLRQLLLRDVTETRRLEARALHAERLAALGRLAAGLAHELRNTLAGVDAGLQVLERGELPPPGERREVTREMRARIERARRVLDDVLAWARPPRLDRFCWPVPDLLESFRDAATGVPGTEGLTVEIADPGPVEEELVLVDPLRISQVAVNLLQNAARAMGGQGRVLLSAAREGRFVSIRFRDHGPGIAPGIRDRVFEPFFTTSAEGTGLGLPIARSLAEAHGGRLVLEETGRGGTTFRLDLPACGAAREED